MYIIGRVIIKFIYLLTIILDTKKVKPNERNIINDVENYSQM